MTRGKYKTASEARRVRESALGEVEAGRRTIVRLTSENAELRETLSRERANLTEKLRLANGMIAEGTSAELEALKGELARSREEARQARRHIAKQVQKLMQTNGIQATFAFYAECADLLDITVQELLPRTADINRDSRRASASTLRLLAATTGLFTPGGLARAFESFEAGSNAGRARAAGQS